MHSAFNTCIKLILIILTFDFQVVSIRGDELVLEAFKLMRDNRIGGLPVVEGPSKRIIASLSVRDIRFLLLEPQFFSNFR